MNREGFKINYSTGDQETFSPVKHVAQPRYRYLRTPSRINDECRFGTLPVFAMVDQTCVVVKAAQMLNGQLFVQCRTGAWFSTGVVYQDMGW